MAQKATIFKAQMQISDMDRHYYNNHNITLARHPSETDERMMMRVLAFAMYASEALSFANGLSSDDEPDLWEKDLTGAISLWIKVGRPDEKHIKKACSRSKEVVIVSYGVTSADLWWSSIKQAHQFTNLTVINVASATSKTLIGLVERGMDLQWTKQDGTIWLSCKNNTEEMHFSTVKKSVATP